MEEVKRGDIIEGITKFTVDETADSHGEVQMSSDTAYANEMQFNSDYLESDDVGLVDENSYLYSIPEIDETDANGKRREYYNDATENSHENNQISEMVPEFDTPVLNRSCDFDESEEHIYDSILSRKSDTGAYLSFVNLVKDKTQDGEEYEITNKQIFPELTEEGRLETKPKGKTLPNEPRSTERNSRDLETLATEEVSSFKYFDDVFGGMELNPHFQQGQQGPSDGDTSGTGSYFSSLSSLPTSSDAYRSMSDSTTDDDHNYCISSRSQEYQTYEQNERPVEITEGLSVTFLADQVKTYRKVCDTSKRYKECVYIEPLKHTDNYKELSTNYHNSKEQQRYVSGLVLDVKSNRVATSYSTSVVVRPKSEIKTNVSRIDYHVTPPIEDSFEQISLSDELSRSNRNKEKRNHKMMFTFGRWRHMLRRYGGFLES